MAINMAKALENAKKKDEEKAQRLYNDYVKTVTNSWTPKNVGSFSDSIQDRDYSYLKTPATAKDMFALDQYGIYTRQNTQYWDYLGKSREEVKKMATDYADEMDKTTDEEIRAELQRKITNANNYANSISSYAELNADYESRKPFLDDAKVEMDAARAEVDRLASFMGSDTDMDSQQYQEYLAAERAYENARDRYNELQSDYDIIGAYRNQKYVTDRVETELSALPEDVVNSLDIIDRWYANSAEDVRKAQETIAAAGYTEEELKKIREYRQRKADYERSAQNMQKLYDLTGRNDDTKILGSIASVPANLLGGVSAINEYVNALGYADSDAPLNIYSRNFALTRGAQTMRQSVMDSALMGDKLDWVYQTGMSGLDSLAAALIPVPGVGAGLLGASAMASTAVEMTERGASASQAITAGLAAGTFEALFEKVSIGQFKAMQAVKVKGVKTVLGNLAKSAGVNFTEEGLTEIANIAYDILANGGISNYETSIRNYMAQGMSEEEAKKQTAKDFGMQVLEAAAAGALMGVGFGGISTGMSAIQNRANTAAYEAGKAGIPRNKVNLADEAQEAAYEAGRKDAILEMPKQEEAADIKSRIRDFHRRNSEYSEKLRQAQELGEYSEELKAEGEALTAEYSSITQEVRKAEGKLSADFGQEANHIDNRTYEGVGAKNVKAFGFDHPELHQYYVEAATELRNDASNSLDSQTTKKGGGVKSDYSDIVKKAMNLGLTRGEIIKACEDIIADNGQENYAVAKRVELLLDDMLSKGYWSFASGSEAVPANAEYIATKEKITGAVSQDSWEYFLEENSLSLDLGEVSEEELRAEWEKKTANAAGRADESHDRINYSFKEASRNGREEDHTAGARLEQPDAGAERRSVEGFQEQIREILLRKAVAGGNARPEQSARVEKTENSAAFKERVERAGLNYGSTSKSKAAVAFKNASTWNENANTAKEKLEEWGFTVVIFEGELLVNRRGVTETATSALTSDVEGGVAVYLSAELKSDGLGIAYHEAFHALKKTENAEYRTKLMNTIASHVNSTSEDFERFINNVADVYAYAEQEVSPDLFVNEIIEETYAWIIGELYAKKDRMGLVTSFTDDVLKAEIDAIYDELANPDMPAGMGAASTGFNPYSHLALEYGTIEPGENAVRDANVPKKTAENMKVSQTVRTIMEAGATPDIAIPNIEELVVAGEFSYEAYTDKQAIADAEEYITEKGWDNALQSWRKDVEKGVVSKENTAIGWALYNNAVNSGNVQTAMDILNAMVVHQRNAAQAVQATRILKKLSPETQLYGVQRSVENLQEELVKKYGDKAPDLTIKKELAELFVNAKDQKQRDKIMKDIYRDIGRQMPSRFIDKWNAWRYLAMLGNPRTHVRNIVGNAFFAPVVAVKTLTATGIEAAVYRISGGKMQRSKGGVSRELLKAAWGDYTNVQELIDGEGKYSDFANANKYIEEGRKIFGNTRFKVWNATGGKALETSRKGNSWLLNVEDKWFSKPHYAFAMAQYCKANGITAEMLRSGEGLDKARAYAVKEAQKATYRDTNAFSQVVSSLGRSNMSSDSNAVKKGLGIVVEGILPFRKTPANILVRGLEYSPAGLIKGLTYDLWKVSKGEKTAAEAVDGISAGLTGTGLLALGIWLAAEGLIRGHGGDDDKKKEFEELMGHQAYALELPDGTSITLDWLAPECLPLFVGVNLWESTQAEEEELTLAAMLNAAKMVTEPLMEMSCLQSLNDVFDAVGYAATEGLDGLPAALANAASSYLTQGVPTLLGQAERTGEDVRMTTYTEKGKFLTGDTQYTIGKISSRIPVWDYQQIPYIDAWGRTESSGGVVGRALGNFINPAYTSKVDATAMEVELLRLYEETGEGGVLPSRASRYFNVDKERKDLTAEEYVKYASVKGQTAYAVLANMVSSEAYKSMDDAKKVEAVKKVYEYANAVAKTKVSEYKPEGWVAEAIKTAKETNIAPDQYVTIYISVKDIESLKDAKGESIPNSKSLLIMDAIYGVKGLNDKQRQALFKDFDVGKTVRGYSRALVKEKLAGMRK